MRAGRDGDGERGAEGEGLTGLDHRVREGAGDAALPAAVRPVDAVPGIAGERGTVELLVGEDHDALGGLAAEVGHLEREHGRPAGRGRDRAAEVVDGQVGPVADGDRDGVGRLPGDMLLDLVGGRHLEDHRAGGTRLGADRGADADREVAVPVGGVAEGAGLVQVVGGVDAALGQAEFRDPLQRGGVDRDLDPVEGVAEALVGDVDRPERRAVAAGAQRDGAAEPGRHGELRAGGGCGVGGARAEQQPGGCRQHGHGAADCPSNCRASHRNPLFTGMTQAILGLS